MRDDWRTFQRTLRTSRKSRRRRRMALTLFFALLLGSYAAARVGLRFDTPAYKTLAHATPLRHLEDRPEALRGLSFPDPVQGPSGTYEQSVDGHRIVYTLDPELQELARSVLRQNHVPYGAFVALDPRTGRVLALAEYSEQEPARRDFSRRATYPAASLIKVITASAALGTGAVNPDSVFRFEGSPYILHPRKISPQNSRRENNVSTLANALGKSNNVVFGKVGADVVGAERLESALGAFGFNRQLPFDFPLQMSRAEVPRERYELARTSAGFGEVYVSPVHAALIAAAVANRGLMMSPYMVQSVQDASGKVIYRPVPKALGRAVSEPVAASLAAMMEHTVTEGTSSRVFLRYARKLWQAVGVAGKTGSLTGDDPPGMYEWFIGFAPVGEPKIAVASLVVNHDLWHIKGTYVAQAVMREFFGM